MSAQILSVPRKRVSPGPATSFATNRPIDLVHLSRQTLGDQDLELELLGLFERQAGLIVTQMAGARDRRFRHDLAHTLKGSAGAVGAGAVAHAAQAYEDELDGGMEESRLAVAMSALEAAVADARAAVTALLQDR